MFRRVSEEVFLAARPLLRENALWIDLGCGTGELGRQLAGTGARVMGIDLDPAMLQWSRQHTLPDSSIGFLAASTTDLPCTGDSVDGIVAASLTGCLDTLEPFWRELSRVLVPGGYAVVSFTNRQSTLLALTGLWRRFRQNEDSNHPCHGAFIRHRMEHITDSASRHGLRTTSIRYFNAFADLGTWSLPPVRVARSLEPYTPRRVQQFTCRNFVLTLRKTRKSHG